MNSQFKNSNFGFILYASIILVIVAATIFMIWYMTAGYKIGTYEPETRLGNVYIGGLTEEEVIPKLQQKTSYWYNDDTVVFELRYQDYTYEFDRSLLEFDYDLSIAQITDGITNPIFVTYQSTDRSTVVTEINNLDFLENIIDKVDLNDLFIDMLADASLMKSYSSKDIEDYLIQDSNYETELDSASFSIPLGVSIDDVISGVNTLYEDGKIVITEKSLFDIVTLMSSELSDAEMSVLSSAMLETILETNFQINEVHYEPNIDFTLFTVEDYPYYARNTHVNQVVNESFSFFNPNEYNYYFTIEKIDDFNGIVHLYGLDLEYDIVVDVQKTEIDYISQGTSDVSLLQVGHNGVVVEVTRTITDVYGVEQSEKTILFEFYPPVKEIVFEP
jgi:hypothetical protein